MKLWTPWSTSGAPAAITTSWIAVVVRRRRIGVIVRWTSVARQARADLLVLAVHLVVHIVVARRQLRRRRWSSVIVGVKTVPRPWPA
eukprot:5698449-Heterocapsa_arctica.AAC.1